MRQDSIRTADGTIVYWKSDVFDPSGNTLFFLHGMTADHTMFRRQIAHFEASCNLVVWDAPAHGASRPFGRFSLGGAADAMAQILEKEHAVNTVLIGQSLGGYFAQTFLCKYPDRAKGFVSIGSTPFGEEYYSAMDRWLLKQIEWMASLYPLHFMKKAIARQVCKTDTARDNMMQMLAPYGKRELCRLLGIGYASFLNENRPLKISCPVLLLVGEQDRTGKVKAYNKRWAENAGFPLGWIPNAAHNANVDNPEAVNAAIAAFLARTA